MIRAWLGLAAAAALAGCAVVPEPEAARPVAAAPAEPVDVQLAAAGEAYAEQRCAACHAIGLDDASPRLNAPPLRDFFKRYPREDVRRAFIQGVHLGAPDMPTFTMSAAEADRLVEHLRSLDPCAQQSGDRAAMERCFAPL